MSELKVLIKRVRSELSLGRRATRLAIGGLLAYVARHFSRTAYDRLLQHAPGSSHLIEKYRQHTRQFVQPPPIPEAVIAEITNFLGCVPKVGLEIALMIQPSGIKFEHYAQLVRLFVGFVEVDLRINLAKLIQSQTYDLTDLAKNVLRQLDQDP